jgi:hypothetical protein
LSVRGVQQGATAEDDSRRCCGFQKVPSIHFFRHKYLPFETRMLVRSKPISNSAGPKEFP